MASLLKMKSSLVVKMKNGPVGAYFSLLNVSPLLPAAPSPSTRSLNTMTPDSSTEFPSFPDLVNGPKNGLSKMMEDINETLDYMKAEIEEGADAYKGWEYSKQDEAAIYFKFYIPGFEKEHLNFTVVKDNPALLIMGDNGSYLYKNRVTLEGPFKLHEFIPETMNGILHLKIPKINQ